MKEIDELLADVEKKTEEFDKKAEFLTEEQITVITKEVDVEQLKRAHVAQVEAKATGIAGLQQKAADAVNSMLGTLNKILEALKGLFGGGGKDPETEAPSEAPVEPTPAPQAPSEPEAPESAGEEQQEDAPVAEESAPEMPAEDDEVSEETEPSVDETPASDDAAEEAPTEEEASDDTSADEEKTEE